MVEAKENTKVNGNYLQNEKGNEKEKKFGFKVD